MFNPFTHLSRDVSPAPVLQVIVHFRGTRKSSSINMKIDTGASRSVLPITFIENHLDCDLCAGLCYCTDYNGKSLSRPVYVFDLTIQNNTFPKREIIGADGGQYGLLGRDILDQHQMFRYDGPNQRFELQY